MKKDFLQTLKVIALALILVAGTNSLRALASYWANPGSNCTPPSCNAAPPLHAGAELQTKTGPLVVNAGGAATGLVVPSGNVGIGTGSIVAPRGGLEVSTGPAWSSYNYGANLVIGGTKNNSIAILGANNSTAWGITNAGNLKFSAMPNLGDTTSVPSYVLSLDRGGAAAISGNAFYLNGGPNYLYGDSQNLALRAHNAVYIQDENGGYGKMCLSGVCRSDWPSGGSGTPTALSYTTYVKSLAWGPGVNSQSISCDNFDVATGGGISQGSSASAHGNWSVAQSHPDVISGAPHGWYCDGEAGTGVCYVICLKNN